jgi:hypothetical protein
MVENSVRSDVLPVLTLGGHAVHVPYPLLWELEHPPEDHGHEFGRGATVDVAKLHCPWHHCIRSCVNACAIGLSRRPADTGSTTGSGSI